jgi:transmembrane sensor
MYQYAVFCKKHSDENLNLAGMGNSIHQEPPYTKPIQINLADGTIVWLAWGSSLSYPHVFEKGSREVTLNGEACFEVAVDPSTPFVVCSKTLERKELEGKVIVRVVEGEIEVNDKE